MQWQQGPCRGPHKIVLVSIPYMFAALQPVRSQPIALANISEEQEHNGCILWTQAYIFAHAHPSV
jgi:hypothetical protein